MFYKNDFSFGIAILNLYMVRRLLHICALLTVKIFGGTNWGNLGHPGGYTSYDYGASITESRNITREKYSELKLLGNFAKVSPSYLTATPGNRSTTRYTTNPELTVTPLNGDQDSGSYFIARHTKFNTRATTDYKLKVPTSAGDLTIPQLGGSLSLNGRDSKIHVVDYDVAGTNILYSTAEVFTWKQFGDQKVLVVYGGPNEHHELAVSCQSKASVIDGPSDSVSSKEMDGAVVVGWDVSSTRRIVEIGDLRIFLLGKLLKSYTEMG